MKCEDAVDLIVDSLLDSLDEQRRDQLAVHIESCPACAAEAKRMSMLWDGLGQLDAPAAAPRAAVEFGRRLANELRAPRFGPLLRIAAAVVLLLIGAAAGYGLRGGGEPVTDQSATAPPASTFLLLVRGEEPQAPVSGDALVQEYAAWASALGDQGRLVGANKLTNEPGRWVSTAATERRTRSDVQGYFLISAADYDEATQIAQGSPHIRYGGTFEIRQIDPVN